MEEEKNDKIASNPEYQILSNWKAFKSSCALIIKIEYFCFQNFVVRIKNVCLFSDLPLTLVKQK